VQLAAAPAHGDEPRPLVAVAVDRHHLDRRADGTWPVLEELAERLQLLVLAVGVDQDLRGHRVNVGGHRSNPIPEGQPANCSREPRR
jgi:hypothetical protein